MSKFQDKCCCGKEFTNYHERIAYRRYCSVGCEVDERMSESIERIEEDLTEARRTASVFVEVPSADLSEAMRALYARGYSEGVEASARAAEWAKEVHDDSHATRWSIIAAIRAVVSNADVTVTPPKEHEHD